MRQSAQDLHRCNGAHPKGLPRRAPIRGGKEAGDERVFQDSYWILALGDLCITISGVKLASSITFPLKGEI